MRWIPRDGRTDLAVPLLEIRDLHTRFDTPDGPVRAVDGLSLSVERGEVLCLVGESGSGKTVACLSVLGLVPSPPGRVLAGSIAFRPQDDEEPLELTGASEAELRAVRGNRVAMVFQDPMTSLNPYLTVGAQLLEVLEVHRGLRGEPARDTVVAMLERVGIAGARRRLDDHPHQLSGGMRQRVMIAMALLCKPDLLIADEPTTALDVTVQAQILALLAEQTAKLDLGVIWITHDLGVVAAMADRVAVMYAGRIVERGPVEPIFDRPAHPYTEALLRSIPRLDQPGKRERPLDALGGLPPTLTGEPAGCPFRPRCSRALDRCADEVPGEAVVGDPPDHFACCHLVEERR
ncbi:MAG: ABC transporter ATP-binding protein [Deltaproteobacteria bacterium]|jgi:oligopeptide/dipeptide ABC transporter ATP-binding protein|nr:ABC transporter ATP-binding protein [Deltaproteobacteria bacterium]MBW2537786.1 ABC transporter ATP-binding protein [Deltaproteobacteria bacterium]